MATVRFFKVSALPPSLEPNAFYYVQSGGNAETYLTDSFSVPHPVGNTAMINSIVNTTLNSYVQQQDSTTPFFIPDGVLFTVNENKQALKHLDIDVEGLMEVNGALVEV
jgi:hypothetical protein